MDEEEKKLKIFELKLKTAEYYMSRAKVYAALMVSMSVGIGFISRYGLNRFCSPLVETLIVSLMTVVVFFAIIKSGYNLHRSLMVLKG